MAIHVSTNYHWINPPRELEDKAFDISLIAAYAKRLKLTDLYSQAEKAYSDLYNQWERESTAMAKQKTGINWLGGGNQYYAHSLTSWDTQYELAKQIAELCSIEECAQELKKLLSKK